MIRDREALILAGRLSAHEDSLLATDVEARRAAAALDRAERDAGLALAVLVTLVGAAALLAGGWLLAQGRIDPAQAAIGLFVALALAETLMPLRRGVSDLGRMIGAARRVAPDPQAAPRIGTQTGIDAAPLLCIDTPALSLTLAPGEAVALTGPSGVGKTTLLMQIAGLADGAGITVAGCAPRDWNEAAFRDRVTLLPQRSALIAGTIRDNLTLAGSAPDADLWQALEAVALAEAIRTRGGLDSRLGEGGAGLSGGQARRLALARTILKKPDLLLLDEPTEGLDPETAIAVLDGLRRALPQAAILVALHRGTENTLFSRVFSLPS